VLQADLWPSGDNTLSALQRGPRPGTRRRLRSAAGSGTGQPAQQTSMVAALASFRRALQGGGSEGACGTRVWLRYSNQAQPAVWSLAPTARTCRSMSSSPMWIACGRGRA